MQVLSTRKRKDADVDDLKVQVCVFAFDMLYLNGEPLLRKTLSERRDHLRASFTPLEVGVRVRVRVRRRRG